MKKDKHILKLLSRKEEIIRLGERGIFRGKKLKGMIDIIDWQIDEYNRNKESNKRLGDK